MALPEESLEHEQVCKDLYPNHTLPISHKNISNWREKKKKIKHLKITLTKSQDFQNRSLTDCHRNAQWSIFTKHGSSQTREQASTVPAKSFPLWLRRKDLLSWDAASWSEQFKLILPNIFAYSETYKFNIRLRLNLKWHYHLASCKHGTSSKHTEWY